MELGFMPEALSTKPEGYPKNLKTNDIIWAGGAFHYPPKDYKKWGDLCHAWTRHCVERYGRQEAASWRWQVWNEPNINYWKGTPEEFLKLYDYAADGIRRALPEAIIGGPHTADGNQNKWMPQFFEHVLRGTNFATGKVGSPLDFVAFHAKGKPSFTNNHVRMGIAKQLSIISNAFTLIGTYPELKDKPIIFGETDPDGCAACIKPDLGYRNTTLYSSYTAASFIRKLDLAARYGLRLEGAVTWAFEFEHSPLFSNQRQLTTGGIDLPVRHVFRLFDRLRGERISATSDGAATLDDMANKGVRDKPDVGVFASRDGDTVKVLLWHYHDDDVPGPDAAVTLRLTELPFHAKRTTLREFRIDTTHSNALEAWKKMGSPASPTPEQREQLKSAAALAAFPVREASVTEGALTTAVTVPRQAVVLLEFETPP
jgi:xylan 1,4-beta-xylosidase